jgi:hypothetical protein
VSSSLMSIQRLNRSDHASHSRRPTPMHNSVQTHAASPTHTILPTTYLCTCNPYKTQAVFLDRLRTSRRPPRRHAMLQHTSPNLYRANEYLPPTSIIM